MRITGSEDPAGVVEQIEEEGREAALARVETGMEWPQVDPDVDTLPDAVAWTEAWDAAMDATRATEIEGGIDPRVPPPWPRGEFSTWALGRHADGGPGLWRITMDFDGDDKVVWLVEDLDEEEAGRPPLTFLQKVPSRESEAANRAAWAARDHRYAPFAPPDEDDPS